MSEWISIHTAVPHNGDIVKCEGFPVACGDQDMGEKGIYICRFVRKMSSHRVDKDGRIYDLQMSEDFEVIDDTRERFMINITRWMPSREKNS